MAYDETFHEVPVFNERELYELPEIQSGEVDLPQTFLDGAIKLEKVRTSPAIQNFAQDSLEDHRLVIVKESSTVIDGSGHEHTVGWCRICDLTTGEDHHQIVCDHVDELGAGALSEELLFACSGVQEAIRLRALIVQRFLDHENTIGDQAGSYGGRRGIVKFLLDYNQNQPHSWLVSHRSDRGNIAGFAALMEISEPRMRKTARLMALDGEVELTGPDSQVIAPLKAA